MNERIKELAIQAGFFYEDYKDIWYLEYHNQTCEEEMKKFAELIIQECSDLFEIEWGEEKLTGNDVGYVLKKHFGVEE